MQRFGIAVLLVAVGVLVTPAAASAHAELVSSDPGYGESLGGAPADVRLDFSGAVDLTAARVTLQGRAGTTADLRPEHATADRRVVSIPLPPRLEEGAYTLVWFFLGGDGHLMGGEVPFSVGEPEPGIGAPVAGESGGDQAPAAEQVRTSVPVAAPQALVRLLDYASLAVLLGGGFFLARVWAAGASDRRAQRLLWGALLGSAGATLLTFAFTAAGLRGVGALDAFDPAVVSGVLGTRFSRIMALRGLFLGLAVVAVALVAVGRERAVRARWWRVIAGVAGGGVVASHALLGHASNEGFAARLAAFVHVAGVAVWLGGLVFLAVVVLPGRRPEDVRDVLGRFSRLAFTAVSAMVVAGAVMLIRVVGDVGELPRTGYGRILLVKLAFVGLLLVAAQQARTFTERRLVQDATRLRPLVLAVGVELAVAVLILSSTSVLAGRVPPGERAPSTAASTVKGVR